MLTQYQSNAAPEPRQQLQLGHQIDRDVDTNFVSNLNVAESGPLDLERNERLRLVSASLPNNMHPFAAKQMLMAQKKSNQLQQANWQSVKPTLIEPSSMQTRDARSNRQTSARQVDELGTGEQLAAQLGIQMRVAAMGRPAASATNKASGTLAQGSNSAENPNWQQQQRADNSIRFEQQQQNQMADYGEENEPEFEGGNGAAGNMETDQARVQTGEDSSSSSMMAEPSPGGQSIVTQKSQNGTDEMVARAQPKPSKEVTQTDGPKKQQTNQSELQISKLQPNQASQATAKATSQQVATQQANDDRSSQRPQMATVSQLGQSTMQRPMGVSSTMRPADGALTTGMRGGQSSRFDATEQTATTQMSIGGEAVSSQSPMEVDLQETPISIASEGEMQQQPKTTTPTGRVELENGRPATGMRSQASTTSVRLPGPNQQRPSSTSRGQQSSSPAQTDSLPRETQSMLTPPPTPTLPPTTSMSTRQQQKETTGSELTSTTLASQPNSMVTGVTIPSVGSTTQAAGSDGMRSSPEMGAGGGASDVVSGSGGGTTSKEPTSGTETTSANEDATATTNGDDEDDDDEGNTSTSSGQGETTGPMGNSANETTDSDNESNEDSDTDNGVNSGNEDQESTTPTTVATLPAQTTSAGQQTTTKDARTSTTQQPALTTIDIERLPKGLGVQTMSMMMRQPGVGKSESQNIVPNSGDDIPRIKPEVSQAPTRQANTNLVMMTLDQGKSTIDGETAITMPMETLMRLMMNQGLQGGERGQTMPAMDQTTPMPSAPLGGQSQTIPNPVGGASKMTNQQQAGDIRRPLQVGSSTMASTRQNDRPATKEEEANRLEVEMNTLVAKKKLQPPPTTRQPGRQQGSGSGQMMSQTGSGDGFTATPATILDSSTSPKSPMMISIAEPSAPTLEDDMTTGGEPKIELLSLDLMPIQRIMKGQQSPSVPSNKEKLASLTNQQAPVKLQQENQTQPPTDGRKSRPNQPSQSKELSVYEVEPGMRLKPSPGTKTSGPKTGGTGTLQPSGNVAMGNNNQANTVYMIMMNGMPSPAHSKRPVGTMDSTNQQQRNEPSRASSPNQSGVQRPMGETFMTTKQMPTTTTLDGVSRNNQQASSAGSAGPQMRTTQAMPMTTVEQQSFSGNDTATTSAPPRTTSSSNQQRQPTTLDSQQTTTSRPTSTTNAADSGQGQKDSRKMGSLEREQQASGPSSTQRDPSRTNSIESTTTTASTEFTGPNNSGSGDSERTTVTTGTPTVRLTTFKANMTENMSFSPSNGTGETQDGASQSSTPIAASTTTQAPSSPMTVFMQQQQQQRQQMQNEMDRRLNQTTPSDKQIFMDANQIPAEPKRENQVQLERIQQPKQPATSMQPDDRRQQQQFSTKSQAPSSKLISKPSNGTSSFIPSKLRNDFSKLSRLQQQPSHPTKMKNQGGQQSTDDAQAQDGVRATPIPTTTQLPLTGMAIRQFGGSNRMSAMANQPVPFGRPSAMVMQSGRLINPQQAPARVEYPVFEYGPSIAVRRPDEPLANGQIPNCTLTGKNFCVLTKDYPMNEVRQAVERSFRSVRIMYEELQTVSDQELHKDDFNATNNQAASGKFACQTQVEMMRPGWAKDEITKEWMLVVNTDVFPQRVRTESCAQPNTPCEFIAPFYDSTCQQRYSLHRMIAIDPHDPSRSPQVAVFKFPAGCVCRVHPIRKTTASITTLATTSAPNSMSSSSTSKASQRR